MLRYRYPIFIFLCCLGLPAFGQTFSPAPGPHLQKETALEQATECYIFFDNPGGDTLQLRWKQIEISKPASWNIDLCDYGLCYTGIPAAGLMNPAADTARPYLKLIVQPGNSPGAAWLWFRVWENGNPDNFQDVYFDLHTPGITTVQNLPQAEIQIFPNPADAFFYLKNPDARALPARVLNAAGQIFWSGALPAQQNQQINCSNWPSGPYFLQTKGKTQTILRL